MTRPHLAWRAIAALTVLVSTVAGLSSVACFGASANFSNSSDGVGPDDAVPEITDVRVGFAGLYKLGCWTPVRVTLNALPSGWDGRVSLDLPDGDGLATRYSSGPLQQVSDAVQRPSSPTSYRAAAAPIASSGPSHTVQMSAKFGRARDDLVVTLTDDGQMVASRRFPTVEGAGTESVVRNKTSTRNSTTGTIKPALPSTDELFVVLGGAVGLDEMIRPTGGEQRHRIHVAHLENDESLPTDWYAYDGVRAVILSTSDPAAYRRLERGGLRLTALRSWVEMGGLLVLCVGRQAPQVLADDSALSTLAPGKFQQMVTLRTTKVLEEYCNTTRPIRVRGRSGQIEIPQLVDARGEVEVFAGARPDDRPLVVRTGYGFGQIVFAGLDLDRPPLDEWQGRSDLLRRLLQRPSRKEELETVPTAASFNTQGYDELSGQLRAALDRFPSVRVVPFAVVVTLAVLYIALIGPGDYFFLKKAVGRMEWTWLTFTVLLIGSAAGAYLLAVDSKGDLRHTHQVELIDVDTASGLVRGTAWCNLFTPDTRTYDLVFAPALPRGAETTEPRVRLSWMGVPGRGLGGMRSVADQPLFARPYRFSPALDRLTGVPIAQWSAKSFIATWTTQASAGVSAELTEKSDRMLVGTLTNRWNARLNDCLLLYDRWLYKIPSLAAGEQVAVDDSLRPTTVRSGLARGVYDQASRDTQYILQPILFHKALGGQKHTRLGNEYLSSYDLSELLRLHRAVLVARLDAAGEAAQSGQLLDGDVPLGTPGDPHLVMCRFVLPVAAMNEKH